MVAIIWQFRIDEFWPNRGHIRFVKLCLSLLWHAALVRGMSVRGWVKVYGHFTEPINLVGFAFHVPYPSRCSPVHESPKTSLLRVSSALGRRSLFYKEVGRLIAQLVAAEAPRTGACLWVLSWLRHTTVPFIYHLLHSFCLCFLLSILIVGFNAWKRIV